jgi:hypothetical protein
MKKHLLVLALSLFAISVTVKAADMPAGGFAGTWKANFAKSKFPGPPPQVDDCTVDPDGTVTINEVSPEGKHITWHYKPEVGKAVPIIGRDNVTVLVKKINDHTNEQIWTSADGKTNKSKAVLSEDGKTTTFHMDGVDKDGKPFHETVVYDKQ